MSTTEQVLAAHGTRRPADVIRIAALAGLELAAAATMLEKESFGGKNVYGKDRGVRTGGFYRKGGPVTEENFANYKAHRRQNGAQGVGPCQLTFVPFQDRADAAGGCWKWEVNVTVGFQILQDLIARKGVHDGFRAYNGSGDAAERYADDAMSKLVKWRGRLEGSRPLEPVVDHPTVKEGDSGKLVASVQKFMNRTFPLYSKLDLAPKVYGPDTSKVIAEFQRRAGVAGTGVDRNGRAIKAPTWAALEFFGYR